MVSQASHNNQTYTNFGAVVQKISEEIVNEKQPGEELSVFDESKFFKVILEKGVTAINGSADSEIEGRCVDQLLNEGEDKECVRSVLPVFTFTLQ